MKTANRTGLAVSMCAAVLVAILSQALHGGDARDFGLRLLCNGVAFGAMWRCYPIVANHYFSGSDRATLRFFLHLGFWILAAFALFAGFRHLR
jgi:hypothetical protein